MIDDLIPATFFQSFQPQQLAYQRDFYQPTEVQKNMYYREIQFDESDYEDGATPGQEIVTFDDLDDDQGDSRFDCEAEIEEVPPRKNY